MTLSLKLASSLYFHILKGESTSRPPDSVLPSLQSSFCPCHSTKTLETQRSPMTSSWPNAMVFSPFCPSNSLEISTLLIMHFFFISIYLVATLCQPKGHTTGSGLECSFQIPCVSDAPPSPLTSSWASLTPIISKYTFPRTYPLPSPLLCSPQSQSHNFSQLLPLRPILNLSSYAGSFSSAFQMPEESLSKSLWSYTELLLSHKPTPLLCL